MLLGKLQKGEQLVREIGGEPWEVAEVARKRTLIRRLRDGTTIGLAPTSLAYRPERKRREERHGPQTT